jgi:hypothetical protein
MRFAFFLRPSDQGFVSKCHNVVCLDKGVVVTFLERRIWHVGVFRVRLEVN